MTTAADRQEAIFRAAELLLYLAGWRQDCRGQRPRSEVRIPAALRDEATEILRHYPLSIAELNQLQRAQIEVRDFSELRPREEQEGGQSIVGSAQSAGISPLPTAHCPLPTAH
jgi:hypothetical protein